MSRCSMLHTSCSTVLGVGVLITKMALWPCQPTKKIQDGGGGGVWVQAAVQTALRCSLRLGVLVGASVQLLEGCCLYVW